MNNGEPRKISFVARDTVSVSDSFSITTESEYLIISNKEKIAGLLALEDPSEGEMIDTLISLHIVLEVGLNTLFRHVSLLSIKKGIERLEVIKNIDNISFIDKMVLFIYNSKFNFDDIGRATEYHKIIGTLKSFSSIRNQLLHGHSISTVTDERGHHHSKLKESLNKKALEDQVQKFIFILEGMRYYVDCLDSPFNGSGKESFKNSYLDDTFIPENYKK